MVFTRPPEPTPPAPKRRTVRKSKAQREYESLTPEQRAAREEDRRRFRQEMEEAHAATARRSEEQRKESERIAAAEAEIERRAEIRWPGHVVDPAWIKEHNASSIHASSSNDQRTHRSMEEILSDALDSTFKPLFDAKAILPCVVEDKEALRTHEDLAQGLRELIEMVVDYAFEREVEVLNGKEMIPAQPDLAAVYKRLSTTDTIARFIKRVKDSFECCADDSKTGFIFKDETTEALAESAIEIALDSDHIEDAYERLTVAEQNRFIDYLIDSGAVPNPLTT